MVNRGKELIRINPKNSKQIQFSTNGGSTWNLRHGGSSCGEFQDLADNGKEVLATTSSGLWFSTNEGATWSRRSR